MAILILGSLAIIPILAISIIALAVVVIIMNKKKSTGSVCPPTFCKAPNTNGIYLEQERDDERMIQKQFEEFQIQMQQFDLDRSIANSAADAFLQTQFDTMQQNDMVQNNMFNM